MSLFAQNDSLLRVWNDNTLNDSIRLTAIGKYTLQILQSYPDSSEKIAREAIFFAQTKNLTKSEAFLWNSVGGALMYKGKLYESTLAYHKAINLYESLKIKIPSIYGNLGTVYYIDGDNEKAIYYFKSTIEYLKEDDYNSKAQVYHNIGTAYIDLKNYKEALIALRISYKNRLKQGKEELLTLTYNQISVAHREMGDIDSANFYVSKSLSIVKENDLYSLMYIYENLSIINLKIKNYNEAINYSLKAIEIAEKSNNNLILQSMYNNLSVLYEKVKNLTLSYEYYKKYTSIKDSLFNKEAAQKLVKEQLNFEHEKEKALQEKEHLAQIKIEKAKQEKQKIIILTIATGLVLVLFLLYLLFNRFRVIKKQKSIIELQKVQVEKSKFYLEEKNREITDSITYAKRIQNAILPSNKTVKEYLPQSFILYKPKDIIAGDFYWLEHKDDNILFAAADCTGHGVPGAMVSVVCNNGLNRSVREHGLTEPGKILDKTREIVIQEFEKSEDDVKDGMDIALCSLKYKVGSETAVLQYSGANNPLWIIGEGKIIEIKANKQPIGKYDNVASYTTHTIDLQENDSIYLFTDGFADQFGGSKGKKFMYKPFKELLLSIQDKTMDEQKIVLEQHFESWKGNLEQVDDVCVIGIRV
jgi:serine phosphatase RsbU (regulator of sigma subunit)